MSLHFAEDLVRPVCGGNAARQTNDPRRSDINYPACEQIIEARARCMIYADWRRDRA